MGIRAREEVSAYSSKTDLIWTREWKVNIMDNFIHRQPNEEDFDYRLRLWRSRELWDYLQIEWEEDFMPNEMTQKILVFKKQLYKMAEEEIDAEEWYYRQYLTTTELPHEIAWCHIYFKHLADRKNEMKMEKAMDALMM